MDLWDFDDMSHTDSEHLAHTSAAPHEHLAHTCVDAGDLADSHMHSTHTRSQGYPQPLLAHEDEQQQDGCILDQFLEQSGGQLQTQGQQQQQVPQQTQQAADLNAAPYPGPFGTEAAPTMLAAGPAQEATSSPGAVKTSKRQQKKLRKLAQATAEPLGSDGDGRAAALNAAGPNSTCRPRPVEPNPVSWVIPRPVIFHCATFSRKTGLPASRKL